MIRLNGKPINITLFPDNTSQVWKLNDDILETTNFAHVTWDFQHEGEFMHLAQLKKLLDSYGFKTCLRISYLPYARQDKKVSNTETFALRIFNRLIDSLDFDEIICVDPHSNVSYEHIRNFRAEYPIKQLEIALKETLSTLVCYPDKGAHTKYSKVYNDIVHDEYVYGEKLRDTATGDITNYRLIGSHKVQGRSVLIVDDICDGGATFKILTKELLTSEAIEVNLFVSHGIFSKGLKTLTDSGIKRIFTKDGEISEHQENITYRRL